MKLFILKILQKKICIVFVVKPVQMNVCGQYKTSNRWNDDRMTERQKSDRRERQIAKEEGGKRVSGSGSTPFKKEDVAFRGVLWQDKRGSSASIAVKLADLTKLEFHALNAGKVPVMSISFDGTGQDWVCFPRWWLNNQEWWQMLKNVGSG